MKAIKARRIEDGTDEIVKGIPSGIKTALSKLMFSFEGETISLVGKLNIIYSILNALGAGEVSPTMRTGLKNIFTKQE